MSLGGIQGMYDHASEPKELWVIQGARHLEGYAADPSAYLARLRQFFTTHLSRSRS